MRYLFFLLTLPCFAQTGEFPTYANGLIYDETTMDQLGAIVDSLNEDFRTCGVNKPYYATAQTYAVRVRITNKTKNVVEAIERNISLEDFLKQFPTTRIEDRKLAIRHAYKNRDGDQVEQIGLFDPYGNGPRFSIENEFDRSRPRLCEASHRKKNGKYIARNYAVFFPEPFVTNRLPMRYASLVGYSECMVDTATVKLIAEGGGERELPPPKWRKMSRRKQERILQEMRATEVMGFCSQDDRPRYHALYIALLSAETVNWSVFLRAHLDIMNDRFQRASDGSYAWAQRGTYLRELEALDLNVLDLLLGVTLSVDNPAEHHYYASIPRSGRALAEYSDPALLEKVLTTLIRDDELDDYNRIRMVYLFRAYGNYLTEEARRAAVSKRVDTLVAELPKRMRNLIED